MSFDATVVNVMIASPGDVSVERQHVREIIHEWNGIHAEDRRVVLLPLGWDSHATPAMGDRPQAIINKQVLKRCDILVAVFWTRLGSPTGEAASGTVEEINEHVALGKPAMIYFSDAPVHPGSINEEQYKDLRQFRKDCEQRGLVVAYESIGDFREKFTRQLAQTIIREFRQQPMTDEQIGDLATTLSMPALPEKARVLLLEAAQDGSGTIVRIRTRAGLEIHTNGKQFVEPQGAVRVEAVWMDAFDKLIELKLVVDRGHKHEVFDVTAEGYEVADRLRLKSAAVPAPSLDFREGGLWPKDGSAPYCARCFEGDQKLIHLHPSTVMGIDNGLVCPVCKTQVFPEEKPTPVAQIVHRNKRQ